MLDPSAYRDGFARDHLPPQDTWPLLAFQQPDPPSYPTRLNAAVALLDDGMARGWGSRICLRSPAENWSYERLLETANRIASVLVQDFGLEPGNRVLLRSANNLMLAACWLAVLKSGGIAVATMPLLRSHELSHVLTKARIGLAVCDVRLAGELDALKTSHPELKTLCFNTDAQDGLESRIKSRGDGFKNIIPSHDDVALIAFTSGTTGAAKATAHFHRDILAICDCFPRAVLGTRPDDVFAGSAPFAFTFGLGALLLFPLRYGASSVLLERCPPEEILRTIATHRVSMLFTVPTLYRAMTERAAGFDLSSLRTCVSSGEHLPPSVLDGWRAATGLPLLNSIGSTEMLHAFLAMPPGDNRDGAIGRPIPGYVAAVVDADMNPVPPGEIGRLAVRGPTGCRYLDDIGRQHHYVQQQWNLTGDTVRADADGYFRYHARSDDMIVSAGYNISGAEVEEALLQHPDVKECAVVGLGDSARGQVVTAFIVLDDPGKAGAPMTRQLQELVKSAIAPYKYPRVVHYRAALPKTASGKIQRHVLRKDAPGGSPEP